MAGIDPEKLSEELSKRGLEWADKDAAFYALDETKKDVLSECISTLNEDMPQSKAEQKARCMVRWKENQAQLIAARKAMNIAKVNYTVWQSFLELKRSKEATTRAEISLV